MTLSTIAECPSGVGKSIESALKITELALPTTSIRVCARSLTLDQFSVTWPIPIVLKWATFFNFILQAPIAEIIINFVRTTYLFVKNVAILRKTRNRYLEAYLNSIPLLFKALSLVKKITKDTRISIF